jgi:simple sugar transport system permease protein
MQKITNYFKKADRIALALLIGSVLIFVLMGVTHPKFFGKSNLQSMLIQCPEYGILAFGMMIAMIAGGIDLSLVGIANLSGIVAAVLMLRMGGTNLSSESASSQQFWLEVCVAFLMDSLSDFWIFRQCW